MKEININNEQHWTILSKHLSKFLEEGFVEEVNKPPLVCSPLFIIPKREEGKWRVILDLRYINLWQKKVSFHNEGLDTLDHLLKRGDYMTKINISEGFHHIRIKECYRTYLGF